MLSRRSFIRSGSAACTLAAFGLPHMAFARAATERRFVFIIQRGAADGLSILAPTGDPQFAAIRGDFVQDLANGAKLDSFFTLHPALAETAKMYASSRRCSSTPWHRPIAIARTLMDRMYSKPAARRHTG